MLPVNPEALKFEKGIAYREDQQQGTTNSTNTFERYKPQTLVFGFIIDCTGAVEGTVEGERVKERIKDLEAHFTTTIAKITDPRTSCWHTASWVGKNG